MSIIRQRHKNLIMAGSIGFTIAMIILILVYVTLIRGNPTAVNLLLKDSQLKITQQKSEPVKKTKVYTLIEDIEKDTLITREMLMAVNVDDQLLPDNCFEDLEEILGKTTAIPLSSKTILTHNMFDSGHDEDWNGEILEIEIGRIPEIIQIGDMVNLRIHFPTGHNYTILKSKEILHLNQELQVVFLELTPYEILAYSSAMEDCARYSGAKLMMTKSIGESDATISDEDLYPLNPNVLAMNHSLDKWSQRLDKRQTLDDSLGYLFDQNSSPYDYTKIDEEAKDFEDSQAESLEGQAESLNQNSETSEINLLMTSSDGRDDSDKSHQETNHEEVTGSSQEDGSRDEDEQTDESDQNQEAIDQLDFDF